MTKTIQNSDRFRRFDWQTAYALWGMDNLRTCTHWHTMVEDNVMERYGENREWLKEEKVWG